MFSFKLRNLFLHILISLVTLSNVVAINTCDDITQVRREFDVNVRITGCNDVGCEYFVGDEECVYSRSLRLTLTITRGMKTKDLMQAILHSLDKLAWLSDTLTLAFARVPQGEFLDFKLFLDEANVDGVLCIY